MPEPHRQSDRTAAQRQADHAGLARLSDTLLPALVQKLNGSGLGELEVREGDWKIRLRRPAGAAPQRRDRPRTPGHPGAHAQPGRPGAAVSLPPSADPARVGVAAPAVGVFRRIVAIGSRVRSGDRIGAVDLLGIPQDVVSPVDGVLVEYTIETGDAVEYGEEVAFVVEPSATRATDEDGDRDGGPADGAASADGTGGTPATDPPGGTLATGEG